ASDDLARLRHETANDGIESDDRRKDDDGYLGFEPHLVLLSGIGKDILTRETGKGQREKAREGEGRGGEGRRGEGRGERGRGGDVETVTWRRGDGNAFAPSPLLPLAPSPPLSLAPSPPRPFSPSPPLPLFAPSPPLPLFAFSSSALCPSPFALRPLL